MRYYEDFPVGLVNNFDYGYEFTEEEIISFATRWDPQPFHTDKTAAQQSIFGGLVASSVHLFAMAVSLGNHVSAEQKCAAVSALGFNDMKLHAPAKPGDQLRLKEVVGVCRPSNSRPDCGIIEVRNELYNQNDELIFSFNSAALIQRRQA